MLSERQRLSDVATCCNASGDVMHCAGTAGHSTHERALDTVRHATGDPVSAMVNASISQVVLLYSVQLLSFSKTASGTAGARMERRHGWRLRNVGMSAAARAPYAARTSLAHAAAQSRLAHCPAASTVATKRNPRTNVHFSLFLTKSCRLCAGFDVGVAYHSNAGAQPPEGTIQFVAQQNPPPSLLKLQL